MRTTDSPWGSWGAWRAIDGRAWQAVFGGLREVKSVEKLLPIHDAQALSYLRLTGARRALLLNFNELTLKRGVRSFLGYGKYVPADEM